MGIVLVDSDGAVLEAAYLAEFGFNIALNAFDQLKSFQGLISKERAKAG